VNGNIVNKLANVDFLKTISGNDIILLNETWTNKFSNLDIQGYETYTLHRERTRGAKRDSGGMVAYFAQSIAHGVSRVDCKCVFCLEKDLYIFFVYIIPSNSTRKALNIGLETFDFLFEYTARYQQSSDVFCIGDFNSRIGIRPDFVQYDTLNDNDFIPLPDDYTIDDVNSEQLLFNNCGHSFTRASMDKSVNENGLRFLDYCKVNHLRIVNGRVGLDRDVGNFTYCNKNGQSVIDYALAPVDLFTKINSFAISENTAFSDHNYMAISFKFNYINLQESMSGSTDKASYKWQDSKCEDFMDVLNSSYSDSVLQQVNSVLSAGVVNTSEIDNCVMSITELLETAGRSHLIGHREPARAARGKGWYDEECRRLRSDFKVAESKFRESGADYDRCEMVNLRSQYRKLCRQKARSQYKHAAQELLKTSKGRPKQFWKTIKTYSNKAQTVGNCNFEEYFSGLSNPVNIPTLGVDCSEFDRSFVSGDLQRYVDELDKTITLDEVRKHIKRLNNNKAGGYDSIINEFLICGCDILLPTLVILFNSILESGYFPKAWTNGVIIPVHKKGSKSLADNYRGITLLSCLGKLFTSILNSRINNWCQQYEVVIEEQAGFRESYSTVDCMFILHSLINITLEKGGKLYCSFVDFRKAFDLVNRQALWFKLYSLGISSKMLALLRSMYEEVKSCVKLSNNSYSNFFGSNLGVRQGENLSPVLFSLFINDVVEDLSSSQELGVYVLHLRLLLLLFADDMVLFSETIGGLQEGLDLLSEYCSKWGLTVNLDKTKIVIFRKGGRVAKRERWFYNGELVEIVSCFKYLGLVFSTSGSFCEGQKTLSEQGMKALYSLYKIFNANPFISISVKYQLFQSVISPVLSYGCEVWGFREAITIERIHLRFIKNILCVKSSTPSAYVYGELGVLPLISVRLLRIVKYWLKIIISCGQNRYIRIIYNKLVDMSICKPQAVSWVTLLRQLLFSYGFGHVWVDQRVLTTSNFLYEFQLRISDIHKQMWKHQLTNLSDTRSYLLVKETLKFEEYLNSIEVIKYRIALTRFRLSSHSFMIEKGRWSQHKIPVDQRFCRYCLNDIEDEFHVLLLCPLYEHLRKLYLPKYYYNHPSMLKYIALMQDTRNHVLLGLSKCVYHIMKNYNSN